MKNFNRPYDPEADDRGLSVMFPCRTEDQVMDHVFELAYHSNFGSVDELITMSRRRQLALRTKLMDQKEEEKEQIEKQKNESGSSRGRRF